MVKTRVVITSMRNTGGGHTRFDFDIVNEEKKEECLKEIQKAPRKTENQSQNEEETPNSEGELTTTTLPTS